MEGVGASSPLSCLSGGTSSERAPATSQSAEMPTWHEGVWSEEEVGGASPTPAG